MKLKEPMGFSPKMLDRFTIIKKLISEGKTYGEVRKYFYDILGFKKDKFYRTWTSFESGQVFHSKRPIFEGRKKKYLNKHKRCYFCKEKNTIEHHTSYNPEIVVYLCPRCHQKIHFMVKDYHWNNKAKDDRITYLENRLLRLKIDIENAIKI